MTDQEKFLQKLAAAAPIRMEFQFHMVRLKATEKRSCWIRYSISIPYGTIKRQIKNEKRNFVNRISIPYGTIKSGTGADVTITPNKFQFHMVRLKARDR